MGIVNGQTADANDFKNASAGAADAGKGVLLDANGNISNTMLRRGGDGADGAFNISSGTTTLSFASANLLIKNYTSFTISGTATLAFSNPHANGSGLIAYVQGNLTLTSTATRGIDLRSMGATGGAGYVSGGYICGDGGRGAGFIHFEVGGTINIAAAFTADLSGANGGNASSGGAIAGGGGAGGGGSFTAIGDTITANAGTINTAGGNQGSSITSGGCTGTNNATAGTDSYGNIGTIAGGTAQGGATKTTTAPRFFSSYVIGGYIFMAAGAGGGGGGASGCSTSAGGDGYGASLTSKAGFSLVTTWGKITR